MDFVLQPQSLQHLAAIKIVAALWNHHAILTQTAAQADGEVKQIWLKWKKIAEKVEANAAVLVLPQPLKKRVLTLVAPLHLEIYKWCSYHYKFRNERDETIFLNCSLPKQFFWTMHGVIDYAKTAQLMLKDQSLDVERRYEIACVNCLEDEARRLINFVLESKLLEYCSRPVNVRNMSHRHLTGFFTHSLRADLDQRNLVVQGEQQQLPPGASIHLSLFLVTLLSSNRATCEFFFQKLSQPEKKWILKEGAKRALSNCRRAFSCSAVYYLSHMNAEQRGHVFSECMADVLVCLLDWPRQPLFMKAAAAAATVECGRRYITMDRDDYEKVLSAIARRSTLFVDYDYFQLFREFWSTLTPPHAKQSLLVNAQFLQRLFDTKKEEIVDFIRKEKSAHQLLLFRNIRSRVAEVKAQLQQGQERLQFMKESLGIDSRHFLK